MGRSWESYDDQINSGPSGLLKIIGTIVLLLTLAGVGCSIVGYTFGWFSDAADTVKKEVAPSALLTKYEWFKDASAALDAKLASLKVYEDRFAQLKEAYGKTPRSQWAREDREQFNLWASESAGIAASYNQLAADYNAQMAKINWAFTNVGQLPQGATVPLPREYKPYVEHR